MAARTRPRNTVERLDFLRAVDLLRKDEALDADARSAEARLFRPVADAWSTALSAYREATAAAALAQDASDAADVTFDLAARQWGLTVRDAQGKSLAARLTPLLGGHTLSYLCTLTHSEEVSRMSALFERIVGEPDLQGDPDRLAALKEATGALEPLAAAADRATRARLARSKELDEANTAFDASAAQLHRAFTAFLGADKARELLPVFVTKAPAPAAPTTPATPA